MGKYTNASYSENVRWIWLILSESYYFGSFWMIKVQLLLSDLYKVI